MLGHGEIPCGNQARHSPLDGENGELVYFSGSKLWKLAAGWLYASPPCRQYAPSFGCASASRLPQGPMA